MKKANFEVHTSFISPWTWKTLVEEGNQLPILAIRNIAGSKLIGKYQDSSIHFKELSPSNELYREKRDKKISIDEFHKKYILEIFNNVSFNEVVSKIINLYEVSGFSINNVLKSSLNAKA